MAGNPEVKVTSEIESTITMTLGLRLFLGGGGGLFVVCVLALDRIIIYLLNDNIYYYVNIS